MLDIFGQAGISEVILLFVLIFIIPTLAFLLIKLRRYEATYGVISLRGRKKKKKKEKKPEPPPPAKEKPSVPPDVFPYRTRVFLTPSEQAFLKALHDAVGGEVTVYAKVALWDLVESTDKNPGFTDRLFDKRVDFLVCDKSTGTPFTAVCFEPDKKAPKGPKEELDKICKAAGLYLVFLPEAEEYDARKLKTLLEIPEFDL